MRTIKFRGKDILTDKWLYGDLVHSADGKRCAILVTDRNSYDECEVDPDTIGQFTGIFDKAGKEIYEGDIVDAWSQGSHVRNGIIKLGKGGCSFFISNKTNSIVWHLSADYNNVDDGITVVGNIHDNPELM